MCGDGEHVDLSELLHRSDLSGDSLTVTFSRINSRIGQLPLMFSRITLTFPGSDRTLESSIINGCNRFDLQKLALVSAL